MKLHEITGADVLDFVEYLQTSNWVSKRNLSRFEWLVIT